MSCLLQTQEGSVWCEADEQPRDGGPGVILAKGQARQVEVELPAVARTYRFRCGYEPHNSNLQRVLMKLWNLRLPGAVGKVNRKAVDLLWPDPKLFVTGPFQTWQVARATPPAGSLQGFAAEPRMTVRYSDEFRSYYPTRGRRFELDGYELAAPVVVWDVGHHRKITVVRTTGSKYGYDQQRGIITITGEELDQPRLLSVLDFRTVKTSWITDKLILIELDIGHVAGVDAIYDVEDDKFVYRQSLSYGGAGAPAPAVPASQPSPSPNPVSAETIPKVVDDCPLPPTLPPIDSAPAVFLTKEAKSGMSYEIGVYVVQAGDNLAVIAHRLHLTGKDLKELNPGLVPDALQVGQQLRIYEKPGR